MKLGTLRTATGTAAARVDGSAAVEIAEASDVGSLLRDPGWADRAAGADGTRHQLDTVNWATLVPTTGKVICIGLNYRHHIAEMGRDMPDYPTLFAKYTDALVGANDDIEMPPASSAVDWEGELVVVIGATVRGVDESAAAAAIAGFSIMNDVSMRDYQFRTKEWLQGKTFENSTPVGPVLVTTDEWLPGPVMRTTVDGELMQETSTGDLVFGPATLVSYISQITSLRPGDLIATGTPGGVGHARKPPRYLRPGSQVNVTIDGIGELQNTCIAVDAQGHRAGQD